MSAPARPRYSGLLKVVSFIALLSSLAWSQEPTGEIIGTVLDPSGAVVSGAAVTVTNTSTGATRTLTSNSAGVYIAPALTPGIYSVRVTMRGFITNVRNNVEVAVGQQIRMDFSLQLGDVNQSVEINAVSTALDTESTTIGTVINNKSVEDLPLNGRNFMQLGELVPSGTTYGPSNYIAQARGGSDRSQFPVEPGRAALPITPITCWTVSKTPILTSAHISSCPR